jgi:Zn-dependent protease with chaperone function
VTTEVVPEPVTDPDLAPDAFPDDGGPRKSEHARIVAARRRLLGMLVALAIGSFILFVMNLAAWWVVLPPSVMLAGYVVLLREASRADAERLAARRARHAAAARAASAVPAPEVPVSAAPAPPVPAASPAPVPPVPAPDAEIIDITGRVGEEFYDQYADTRRAVGN